MRVASAAGRRRRARRSQNCTEGHAAVPGDLLDHQHRDEEPGEGEEHRDAEVRAGQERVAAVVHEHRGESDAPHAVERADVAAEVGGPRPLRWQRGLGRLGLQCGHAPVIVPYRHVPAAAHPVLRCAAVEPIAPDARLRATSMAELRERREGFVSPEGYAAGLTFTPRPTDVVIAPFAKCGTTWLQQMVHSLRTGGDVDFDDISRVVPWIETASTTSAWTWTHRSGPSRGPTRATWRGTSSRRAPATWWRYATRVDALVSGYRFFEGWFFEPGTISVEEIGRGALP